MKPWMQCALFITALSGVHWAAAQTPADMPQLAEAAQIKEAEATQAKKVPSRRSPGDATRALLQAQAKGSNASTQQYPMSGAVAQKTYERYVNSFSHPIPEHSASAIAKGSKQSR